MGSVSAPSDAALVALAGPFRVLTLEQLLAAGLSEKAIRLRVEQGRLQRLWTGIYLVGAAPPDPLSLAKAADLSCAGDGFVSCGWGCFVHGFAQPPGLPVDVLITRGSRRGRPDAVRTHRSTTLEPRDLGTVGGIRVTSPARAILDCAERLTLNQIEALVADAHAARAVTEAQLEDIVKRAGRRKAAAKLRAILTGAPGLTLSEAERILRRLLP